jgi:hypothetical protein
MPPHPIGAQHGAMAVKLSDSSYRYAQKLIKEGKVVPDEHDDAGQYRYFDIEAAAAHLHGALEGHHG